MFSYFTATHGLGSTQYLVAVGPLHEVHRVELLRAELGNAFDSMCQVSCQGDTHLAFHQGEPFIDLWVLIN